MALDVPVPDSPTLSGPPPGAAYSTVSTPETGGDDYRRDDLAAVLDDGAWADGFEAWAAGTELTEREYALVRRHDLVERLDFYWDPVTEDVGYRAPSLPDDVREALAADTDPDDIEAELAALARTVSERLEADYLDREP